jgi:DNA (cytosine-5)-methyltransferase 1
MLEDASQPLQSGSQGQLSVSTGSSSGSLVAVPLDSFTQRKHPTGGPSVLDLFAGAGGFSLGFEFAGAEIRGAVEIDAWACETLQLNHPQTKVIKGDITTLSDSELLEVGGGVDIVIGGPPCQGFSIANLKAGDPADPRNSLFKEFVRAVDLVKPRAFVMENVPGLLNRRAKNKKRVIDIITREFTSLGYNVAHKIVEARTAGVPQLRPRLFILGFRNGAHPTFPFPTHGEPSEHPDIFGTQTLRRYVTLWDAIGDLPEIDAREGEEIMEYSTGPQNEYQRLVRAGSNVLYNHVAMNHSRRIVERFSHVKWGEAGIHAPPEHQARQRGNVNELSNKKFSQNNRRMHPDRPCHTVPASFYANFIHPYKDRNFTPREGARLQSFPDWYRFCGKPTVVSTKLLAREERTEELHLCQYNQIGNAVPPLLAMHLANHVIQLLQA